MKIIYFLFLTLCLYACEMRPKYKDAYTFEYKDIPSKKNLKGEILHFDAPVMMPMSLFLVDSVLISVNTRTEYLIYRYDVKNMRKIGESISFGNGPYEMLSVKNIQVTDTTIWLFDLMKRKMLQYQVLDLCFSNNPKPLNMVQFTDYADKIVVLPTGNLVMTTLGIERKRLSFANMEGKLITENGNFPDCGIEMQPYEKVEALSCNMIFNEVEEKICLIYKCTDLIEIYDMNGNLLKRSHGPEQFFPQLQQYDIGNGGVRVASVKGKTRDSYSSPINVNNEIWTLYSGEFYDPKIKNGYLLDKLIVFDWDGKPIRQYHLDIPIFTFAIDATSKLLYGITDDPEFNIVRYNLNSESSI